MSKVSIKQLKQDDWQKENGVIPLLVIGRVSYPSLWRPSLYEGTPVNYLGCNALLDGATPEQIKQIKMDILKAARHQHTGIKYAELVDQKFVADDDGAYSLKMRTGLDKAPVFVTTKTKAPVKATTDGEGKVVAPVDPEKNQSATETLYPGCWAMFKVTLSGDRKKKKVWVNIQAIRFVADDVRFGGDSMAAMVDDMGEALVDDMGDELGDDDGLGDDLDDDLDDAPSNKDDDDFDDDIPF